MYKLRYAKHASIALLTRVYRNERAPKLMRKWRVWEHFKSRNLVPTVGFEPTLPRP